MSMLCGTGVQLPLALTFIVVAELLLDNVYAFVTDKYGGFGGTLSHTPPNTTVTSIDWNLCPYDGAYYIGSFSGTSSNITGSYSWEATPNFCTLSDVGATCLPIHLRVNECLDGYEIVYDTDGIHWVLFESSLDRSFSCGTSPRDGTSSNFIKYHGDCLSGIAMNHAQILDAIQLEFQPRSPTASPTAQPTKPTHAPTFIPPDDWTDKIGSRCDDGWTDVPRASPGYDLYCEPCPDDQAGTSGKCEPCSPTQNPNHTRTDCEDALWFKVLWKSLCGVGSVVVVVAIAIVKKPQLIKPYFNRCRKRCCCRWCCCWRANTVLAQPLAPAQSA